MTAQEVAEELGKKLASQFEELGVTAFTICAYVEGGDGKVEKIVLSGLTAGANPAYADGLSRMRTLGAAWGRGEL